MHKKISAGTIIRVILMILVSIVILFPFFWILSNSLKTNIEISLFPPHLIPEDPQWGTFGLLLTDAFFWRCVLNTILLILGNTVGTLISSSVVAYPLARMNFKGKNFVFAMIVAMMMVPGITLITPQYMLFAKFGWLDTLMPMVVPAFFAHPYNTFLFRQFYRTIPIELDEAAEIDGCNRFMTLTKVILPLAKPIFVTIGILSSVFWWNELPQPLIYINSDEWMPLTVALMTRFKFFGLGPNTVTWNTLMAVAVLMILPPIILYLVASDQLVDGIKTSGIKG